MGPHRRAVSHVGRQVLPTTIPNPSRSCLLVESAPAGGESAGSPPGNLAPSLSPCVWRHAVSTLLRSLPHARPPRATLLEPQAAAAKCQGSGRLFITECTEPICECFAKCLIQGVPSIKLVQTSGSHIQLHLHSVLFITAGNGKAP